MYSRKSACGGCGCELRLDCGSDYLSIDGRAVVFGDDGSWPKNLAAVRLLFQSHDECGCDSHCSMEVEGNLFAAGCSPDWPTASSTIPLRSCNGSGDGYAYRANGCSDPAATVDISLCSGEVIGHVYPAPVPGKATTPIVVGCTAQAIVGYALDSINSAYRSAGCTAYPGEQQTAWFDLTAAQTRKLGRFAERYKVIGVMASGSTVVLSSGPVL